MFSITDGVGQDFMLELRVDYPVLHMLAHSMHQDHSLPH